MPRYYTRACNFYFGKQSKILVNKNREWYRINKTLKLIVKKIPNILGVLNLTPDSFSDGGKFNKKNKGVSHAINLYKTGASLVDVGGESTRPGSNEVNENREWNRIKNILKLIVKKNTNFFRYKKV